MRCGSWFLSIQYLIGISILIFLFMIAVIYISQCKDRVNKNRVDYLAKHTEIKL